MNYAKARRQMGGDELWFWTYMNDKHVYRGECCSETCAHKTKAEAERHYYDYSLEQVFEHTEKDVKRPCAVCGEYTDKSLGNARFSLFPFHQQLCDKHRTKEQLALLQPFYEDISAAYS